LSRENYGLFRIVVVLALPGFVASEYSVHVIIVAVSVLFKNLNIIYITESVHEEDSSWGAILFSLQPNCEGSTLLFDRGDTKVFIFAK
jgi:hypothetical protein